MAITNYSSLQTAILSTLHRSSDSSLTTTVKDWIALAEAAMSADLKSRAMETRSNVTCTAGNAYVTLPTDYVEGRRVLLSSTTPKKALKYVTPDEITQDYPFDITGEPSVYAVIGGELQLAPVPDSTYTLELAYVQKIPALSDSNTTNWLLTANPNAYLYGSLVHAAVYLRNDAVLAVYRQLYTDAIEATNTIDWYSGTSMQVRNG